MTFNEEQLKKFQKQFRNQNIRLYELGFLGWNDIESFILSSLQEQKDGITRKLFDKTIDGQLKIKFEDAIKVIESY